MTQDLDLTINYTRSNSQLGLCTAALLPDLQPAPCFLSALIGQID